MILGYKTPQDLDLREKATVWEHFHNLKNEFWPSEFVQHIMLPFLCLKSAI